MIVDGHVERSETSHREATHSRLAGRDSSPAAQSDTLTLSTHRLLQSGEEGVGDAVPGVALVHQAAARLDTGADILAARQVAADGSHKLVSVIDDSHNRASNLLDL